MKKLYIVLLTVMLLGCLAACEDPAPTEPPHEHSYTAEITKAATCAEEGVKTYTCTCGDHYTTPVAKLEHTYSDEVTKEPTCSEAGVRTYTCRCGDSYTESIKTIEHTYLSEITAPTCTKSGYTTYTCACGNSYQDNIVSATGHKYTSDVTAATCTEKGYTTYACTCGDTYRDNEVAANGHSYTSEITTEATCTTAGVKTFTCHCGSTYTESFSMTTYAPTELFELIEPCVGEIIVYDRSGDAFSLGTAFVYSADGKIITNYHVIEDGYSAQVTINGVVYDVQQVLAYDADIDIAVLKIDAANLPVIPVCSLPVKTGSNVYAFGSSQGLTATFSDGIITHASREVDGVIYVQHNAAISSGNSGGPLVNEYGEIIGINTMHIKDSQNLNFAIFCSELDNLTYDTPMTLADLFHNKTDPFTTLKDYAKKHGTYDADDNAYFSIFSTKYTSDNMAISSCIQYNANEDEIELIIAYGFRYIVSITIDVVDGYYAWSYIDEDGYAFIGTVTAATYTSNTLLAYYYTNIPYLVDVSLKIASMTVAILLQELNLSDIGVTAADLGFISF